MSQDVPVTGYAILGLLTFGDELTGYEIKQRADVTLRFYWVSPAMSQIYTELRRLTGLGLVRADARPDDGRETAGPRAARVVRGASHDDPPETLRVTIRRFYSYDGPHRGLARGHHHVGFRCAWPATPPPEEDP